MKVESFLLSAAIVSLLASACISILSIVIKMKKVDNKDSVSKFSIMQKIALFLSMFGFLMITAFVVIRAVRTGHGPFTNMHEFSIAFVWGILMMNFFFTLRNRNMMINILGSLLGAGLLIFATSISSVETPLVPALQNNLLLSAHVFSAVIAYGSFTVGLITSILFLIQKNDRFSFLPDAKTLEKESYRSVIIGFPFMTLVIVLGALWADIAWGRFWGWDPKETASLVTWLIYAGYLHTRVARNWRGRKSAILLILGFIAVLFTFFGNYIFNGLHSYG